ncbi:MAG TPA: lysylphosphatidylglycerol synthase domain-containing protein, partial [Stellaceae bacterium]|nr:lysylphosphatidylglycerol synthase domain-containing protein [Stellaceae bacterium]
FSLFCAWQVLTAVLLGVCWRGAAPLRGTRHIAPFVWGRMVRDAAGSCLPFSAVGGFVLGIRAVSLHGIAWSVVTLSLAVDLTAEFLAQVLFTVCGLLVLLARSTDMSLTRPIEIGIALAVVSGIVVLRLQKGAVPLFVRFGRRILGNWFAGRDGDAVARSEIELTALYGDSRRMALGTAGHLAGWVCKGIGNWITFRLLGSDIDLSTALAIEALLHALLAPAFVVPGYAGVQEVGYAAIGALFGIPPEVSLSVSLLRRARDVAIGVPVLLVWQLVEVRRLHKPWLPDAGESEEDRLAATAPQLPPAG